MAACVRSLGFEKYAQRVADEGYDLRSLVRATPEVPYTFSYCSYRTDTKTCCS